MGLLGTFIGLTIGISTFDSSNTSTINQSIQSLLGGMATAFITSLVGMALSIIFTFFDKFYRNSLNKTLSILCEKLDTQYYIDDITLERLNHSASLNSLYLNVKNMVERQFKEHLCYINQNGETTTIAHAIRELLKESYEQSAALKSFSTDLAIELNNGFDETLSRQMQQKILPLMENVDATTKSIIDHIDKMALKVTAPATDMMQSVVEELNRSMEKMMQEFSGTISGSTKTQFETLATKLNEATQTLSTFPTNMESISQTMQITIEQVKSAVEEMSNTSTTMSASTMQQMQEQIRFATTSINEAINEVKDVMTALTQTSQEQATKMVEKLSVAAENMGSFLNGTISSLSSSVRESVMQIAEDVNNKQADLLVLQEDTTQQTRQLIDSFNTSLVRLEDMNEKISGTMHSFQQAQGEITGSTAHLQTISENMKFATEQFSQSQESYTTKMEQAQEQNQNHINEISDILLQSGEISNEYANNFETIQAGLGSIFEQIQKGLTEYGRTVQSTTQEYLNTYSNALTNSTDALLNIVQQLTDSVELLQQTKTSNKQ